MREFGTNFRLLRVLTWTGPVLIGTLIVAMVAINFIPPPSPSWSAAHIARLFNDHSTRIRVACIIMMIAWSLWATFGSAITMMIRRMDTGLPVITYTSIALVGGGAVFFELIPLTWAAAAFRPHELSPEIIRVMNDWTWFVFLFTVPPFCVWFILVGIAILNDKNVPVLYSRWVGYLNIWLGVQAILAVLVVMFKHGPFGWNGLLAFWVPMGLFAIWFAVMTASTLTAIRRVETQEAQPAPPGAGTSLPAAVTV